MTSVEPDSLRFGRSKDVDAYVVEMVKFGLSKLLGIKRESTGKPIT